MTTTTIRKSIFLAAPREIAWQYLTDKDKLGEWFHPAAASLVAGEPYALLENPQDPESKICWGDVLSVNKPSSLSYTFTFKPLAGATTTVTWTLDDAAGGTRISLLHEGIGEAAGEMALGLLSALDEGWDKHFAKLRPLLAS